jgi:hypothetical protein
MVASLSSSASIYFLHTLADLPGALTVIQNGSRQISCYIGSYRRVLVSVGGDKRSWGVSIRSDPKRR